ncbi:hypothetical protein R5W23_002647 [Gemmata sp. JC673]|uniref:Uncharacterized protein n=1 Tax=Gemmata algarum TaxID=2975278 RepID=A0ABU5F1D3_9BACT|nr:hypothetical protein [Gemmata algarum]MDY3561370.1 hypothetical protein [Gemmata algarum]
MFNTLGSLRAYRPLNPLGARFDPFRPFNSFRPLCALFGFLGPLRALRSLRTFCAAPLCTPRLAHLWCGYRGRRGRWFDGKRLRHGCGNWLDRFRLNDHRRGGR